MKHGLFAISGIFGQKSFFRELPVNEHLLEGGVVPRVKERRGPVNPSFPTHPARLVANHEIATCPSLILVLKKVFRTNAHTPGKIADPRPGPDERRATGTYSECSH